MGIGSVSDIRLSHTMLLDYTSVMKSWHTNYGSIEIQIVVVGIDLSSIQVYTNADHA